MKILRSSAVALLCILALGTLASADTISPTLTLDPTNGALTGPPGSTVGWGFTLTNLGSDFLVSTGSDFCVGVITSPCSNSFGTYTDFAGPQFFVVGPPPESSSFTQSFNNTLQLGMGSFLINLGSTGTVNGFIVLTYDLFSVDPNSPDFNPIADTVSNGNFLTAPASVTVGTAVPEPGSLLLVASGAVVALFMKKRGWRQLRV
jgi:hypothetical protein